MKFFIFILLLIAIPGYAADINCAGKVTLVMDYPPQCGGNLAFKTSGSNGIWICPPSDKSSALLLTAFATEKTVDVYIDNQNGSFNCSTLPGYVKARYIIISP